MYEVVGIRKVGLAYWIGCVAEQSTITFVERGYNGSALTRGSQLTTSSALNG